MQLQRSYIKEGAERFPHYYLSPYLPFEAGKNAISKSLVRFKQRLQPDLEHWIGTAVDSLSAIRPDAATIILRPLRHDETSIRTEFPGALDLLGRALADGYGCRYLPSLLSKSRATLPNKYLTRRQRVSEQRDVYRLALPSPFPALTLSSTHPGAVMTSIPDHSADTPFLLIDDILTTGATMQTLIHILRVSLPFNPIRVFTLTRAANTV